MPVSSKKIVVRQFDGAIIWGYLPATGFVRGHSVEVLDTAARSILLDTDRIKFIAFVKDFNLDDPSDPERLGRRGFLGRPRAEGLWLKLDFRDRDSLEGLTHFDLGFVEAMADDGGVSVVPPDPKSNAHRVFVPRQALTGVQVLGWITAPSRHKAPKLGRVESGDLPFPLEL